MHWLFFLLIIFIDQVSKYSVIENFKLFQSKPIIEGIFHLTYVRNLGAAFSILQNQRYFFIITTTIVVMGILWFIYTKKHPSQLVLYSLIFIAGGAVGNLIDRIRYGYVIDFFDFIVWPVFNIADMSVVLGAILLCYYYLFIDRNHA